MDKFSDVLKKIMLGILLALLLTVLALVVRQGLESRSYLLTLAAGAVWAGLLLFAVRRIYRKRESLLPSLSAKKAALLLTLFCAAINLAWVLVIRIEPWSDYETYWKCACAIANGTAIENPWYIAMYPHILGCASFLSVFVKIFGESVLCAAIVNVALTCVSGLIIFGICLEISTLESACIAFLLWAAAPTKLMLNSLVFSEPLYTCLALLFFYLLILLEKRRELLRNSLPRCILWGALLGLLLRTFNAVRPIASILIISLMIWLLLLRGKELKSSASWRMWLSVLVPLFGVYIITGKLWDAHVESLLGMEVASVPIYNIYVGFNPDTCGQWSAEDMDLLFSYFNNGATTGEAQQSMLPHLKERLASGIDFGRLFSGKLFAFIGCDELGGYTYRYTRPEMFVKICMLIDNVFFYGVFLLSVLGVTSMLRRTEKYSAALLMPLYALGLTLAHMLVEVSTRYHYSIIPILIIFAALSLERGAQTKGAHYDT